MKRPCLDYANLPDVPTSDLPPAGQLIAKIAWLGDNAAYGIEDACKRLIDDVRAGAFSGAVSSRSGVAAREPDWKAAYFAALNDALTYLGGCTFEASAMPTVGSVLACLRGFKAQGGYSAWHDPAAPQPAPAETPIAKLNNALFVEQWERLCKVLGVEKVGVIEAVDEVERRLSPRGPMQDTATTAWMIEFKAEPPYKPLWFTGLVKPIEGTRRKQAEFSADPNAGVRYPTREAAEQAFQWLLEIHPRSLLGESCYAITEHAWGSTVPEALTRTNQPKENP